MFFHKFAGDFLSPKHILCRRPGFDSWVRKVPFYLLQYSWASLVAQMVKNLGWEDPLEEGMATHSSVLAWRIPSNRGAWHATLHGVAKTWPQTLRLSTAQRNKHILGYLRIILLHAIILALFFVCNKFSPSLVLTQISLLLWGLFLLCQKCSSLLSWIYKYNYPQNFI